MLRSRILTPALIASLSMVHSAGGEDVGPTPPAPAVVADAPPALETPAPAADKPTKADAASMNGKTETLADKDDPVVCRTTVETGTIGRRQKVCMTKSQWEAQMKAAKRFKRSIEQTRSAPPAGG